MSPSATTPPPNASPSHTGDQQQPMSNLAKPLAGKVALITGAGRGIGRGIALELGKRGASIVVNYAHSAAAADQVVAELARLGSNAVALQADVSKPEEVAGLFERAVAHFGRGIDYTISNAGMEVWCEETEVTPELFNKVFDLNCRGQFFVAQQGLKHGNTGGRIILTSSIAAQMAGVPNHALYAGSKSAVEGFARAFAVDCGRKRMTCNAIAPGGIQTDMFDANSWNYVPGGYKGMPIDTIKAGLRKMCPLDRVGEPADIGKVVYCLVSDEGEWINGQVIRCSGGGV
ncbi:tetrahydroxynaphthalene reductase [Microdochium nivale]|nr:tetrahydroxynaphthalene reductase [Microdochium nivale]